MSNRPLHPEVEVEFRSLPEWLSWSEKNATLVAAAEVKAIVECAQTNGVESAFLGFVEPARVSVLNNNYRESLLAGGLNPRLRAVLDRLITRLGADDNWGYRIYGHEALTPAALLLRGRFAKYFGSEYVESEEEARALWPIPAIDVERCGLPDGAFDAIVTNDVLEHVPHLDDALRESARILRAGGILLGTFPFAYNSALTEIRAVKEASSVRYLAPPEYHGNPVAPDKGSLVFQVPGWDVIERAHGAGFSDAKMVYLSSRHRGYTGSELPGVFLFEAVR
jgi:SAM-dependent methyltransferase